MSEGGGGRELSLWEIHEAERPAQGLRQLPGVLVRSARFVGAADPGGLAVVLTASVVAGVAAGLQVVATQRVLTAILAVGRGSGIGEVTAPVVLFVLVNAVQGLARTFPARRQELLTERVRRYAQEHILAVTTGVDLAAFDDPTFYDRVQRATQGVMIGPVGLVQGFIMIVQGVLGALGVVLALAAISPLLVLIVLAGYLPVWIVLQVNGRDRFRFFRLQTPLQRRRDYFASLLEQRHPAKEVRAYGLAAELLGRWRRLSEENIAELAASVRRRASREIAADVGSQLGGAVALVVLVWLIATGRVTVPQAGAAATALLALGGQLGMASIGGAQLYETSLFVADYEAFLEVGDRIGAASTPTTSDAPIPPTGPPDGGFREVTLEHVSFRYPGSERLAVDGIDLHLGAGEVVALVGENGSGKTTLAKIVAGLYRPTSGRVQWNDADLAELDEADVRRRIAVVFQDFAQYELTAHENVAFGDVERLDDRDGVRAAARRSDADRVLAGLVDGYDTQLGRLFGSQGADLSIGQWQRVALARAFFRDAPLVILDEPTAALDAKAEHELFATIRDLYADRTVLLISHRFSTVRTADRIYVLHHGRVVEQGTHDELMGGSGRYAELFTLQARAYLADD